MLTKEELKKKEQELSEKENTARQEAERIDARAKRLENLVNFLNEKEKKLQNFDEQKKEILRVFNVHENSAKEFFETLEKSKNAEDFSRKLDEKIKHNEIETAELEFISDAAEATKEKEAELEMEI